MEILSFKTKGIYKGKWFEIRRLSKKIFFLWKWFNPIKLF